MSQAEDLLNNLSAEDIALYTSNPDTEEHIIIDNNRYITVPESLRRIAVQYDHRIETVTFDCPRYWDNNDLSAMNIYISYLRPDRVAGIYLANNVRIDEKDPNIIHFEWNIGEEMSMVSGEVKFSVSAKRKTDTETSEIRWYSEINDQMYVSEGIDGSDSVVAGHPDIINELISRMDGVVSANTPILDTTLTQFGFAADAGVAGNAIDKEATMRQLSDDTIRENLTTKIDNEISERKQTVNSLQKTLTSKIDSLSNGSPLVAKSTSEMVNKSKVYVNTSDGNWYFYNEDSSAWESGGAYQAVGIASGSVTLDKLDLENYLYTNYTAYSKQLSGYNTTTFIPRYDNEGSEYLTLEFDLVDGMPDLIFPLSEVEGQLFIAYEEGVGAVNKTYNNIVSSTWWGYEYNAVEKTVTLKLQGFYNVGYRKMAVQMSPDNYYLKYSEVVDGSSIDIPLTEFIGTENIKKKAITEELTDFQIPDLVNFNYFDTKRAEQKYASGYDTSTGLPKWVDDNNYITITIPCGKNGTIRCSKMSATTGLSAQAFILKADKTVTSNVTNSKIMSATEYPMVLLNGWLTVYADYIEFDCAKIYNHGSRYISVTYTKDLVDEINVNMNGSFIPEWFDSRSFELGNITPVLNRKFKVVANKNLLVYPQNFTRYYNIEKAQAIALSGAKYIFKDCSIYSKPTAGVNSAKLRYSINNTNVYDIEKDMEIEVVDANAGNGLTKKVMFIGDSLTDFNIYPTRVVNLFEDDVMNIELLGSKGTSPNLNEGRSGWRAYTYCNKAKGSDESTASGFYQGSNPFYNPTSKTFDFSYYMNNQGYSSVDYVFINLGTNDVSRANYNGESQILSYYNIMINSIKAFNPNVKIGLWLPPGKGINNDIYGLVSRDNALRMNDILIRNFEGREAENLYLIPINIAINPNTDYNMTDVVIDENVTIAKITDATHPATSGFYKIADVIYYWIKYFGSLDD